MSDAVESAARHTQQRAERAAAALYERDRASQALGMRLLGVRPGWAQVVMRVRPDMVNGHGLCHGGIARLTLNRPERLNSFNTALHAEVRAALAAVTSAAARVLVISGAGRGF